MRRQQSASVYLSTTVCQRMSCIQQTDGSTMEHSITSSFLFEHGYESWAQHLPLSYACISASPCDKVLHFQMHTTSNHRFTKHWVFVQRNFGDVSSFARSNSCTLTCLKASYVDDRSTCHAAVMLRHTVLIPGMLSFRQRPCISVCLFLGHSVVVLLLCILCRYPSRCEYVSVPLASDVHINPYQCHYPPRILSCCKSHVQIGTLNK
jgi:hypothetical protein